MRRPRATLAALLVVALALYVFAPPLAPRVAAARAGDCLEMRIWSNGYHSDIGVPAEALTPDHPLRRLYPQARMLLIGWGERNFYYSDGTDLWLGLDAIVPPSPSVMHVAEDAESGARYLGPTADATLAISREGAARLADFLLRALELDEAGAVVIDRPGKVVGRSQFLRERESFHLFNVCNHWMARALRAAGVNVNARSAWLASSLIREAQAAAAPLCPAGE